MRNQYSYTKAKKSRFLAKLYAFFGKRFREKRQKLFSTFVAERKARIFIDIGGRPATWETYAEFAPRPQSVVIVNLPGEVRANLPPGMYSVIADACQLPFRDGTFDVSFSNSVIEHLGKPSHQVAFANEAIRVSKDYFIQTPNKNFPIEPHYLTPFIHWIPKRLRVKLIRNFTVWGLVERPTKEHCADLIQELRLLNRREFSAIFPGSSIHKERFLGMVKSLIATRAQHESTDH